MRLSAEDKELHKKQMEAALWMAKPVKSYSGKLRFEPHIALEGKVSALVLNRDKGPLFRFIDSYGNRSYRSAARAQRVAKRGASFLIKTQLKKDSIERVVADGYIPAKDSIADVKNLEDIL